MGLDAFINDGFGSPLLGAGFPGGNLGRVGYYQAGQADFSKANPVNLVKSRSESTNSSQYKRSESSSNQTKQQLVTSEFRFADNARSIAESMRAIEKAKRVNRESFKNQNQKLNQTQSTSRPMLLTLLEEKTPNCR